MDLLFQLPSLQALRADLRAETLSHAAGLTAGQDVDAALQPLREMLTRSRYDFRFHVEEFERIRDILRAEVHDHGSIYSLHVGPLGASREGALR